MGVADEKAFQVRFKLFQVRCGNDWEVDSCAKQTEKNYSKRLKIRENGAKRRKRRKKFLTTDGAGWAQILTTGNEGNGGSCDRKMLGRKMAAESR